MPLKRKNIIGIIAASIIVIAIVWVGQKSLTAPKVYTVKRTNFESVLPVKGEIQGKNVVVIAFPDEMKHQYLYLRDFQIKDLIKEGSLIKQGDWVATLDIDNINRQIQENNDEMEQRLSQFTDAKIDSAIELTRMREELKELKYDLDYKELDLEQAKFESPAYQRKVMVSYNKTVRQIEKKRRDYELRRLYLVVRTKRREDHYNFALRRDSLLKMAREAANIKAPRDGMVMYARTHFGRKIRIGDHVSQWNPAIATLPDLSELISETYVEEIHITKLNIGDSVLVTVDAIPGKVYPGSIYRIANIGQELSGFESKVFNVLIGLKEIDSSLKPAMTSNNNIIVNRTPNVLTIPRECLFSENGNSYVFVKKEGNTYKQIVTTGLENDREIIILSGLEEEDKVLLSAPENMERIGYYSD